MVSNEHIEDDLDQFHLSSDPYDHAGGVSSVNDAASCSRGSVSYVRCPEYLTDRSKNTTSQSTDGRGSEECNASYTPSRGGYWESDMVNRKVYLYHRPLSSTYMVGSPNSSAETTVIHDEHLSKRDGKVQVGGNRFPRGDRGVSKSARNKGYPCCSFKFSTLRDLNRHETSAKHKNEPPRFLCNFCGKRFKRRDSISRHRRTGACKHTQI